MCIPPVNPQTGSHSFVSQASKHLLHSLNSYGASTIETLQIADFTCRLFERIKERLRQTWKAIIHFFKLLFHSYTLSAVSREERLCATDTIIKRLQRQAERAKQQMEVEPVKPFQYQAAHSNSSRVHNVTVGGLLAGIYHARGRRPTMEDEHLATSFQIVLSGKIYPIQLFGIFDGHGGPQAAEFVRDHLERHLKAALIKYNLSQPTIEGVWKALRMTGVCLNRDFKNQKGAVAATQGATATIAMIFNDHLWAANIGDARTVLDNHGIAVQLTEDAKPGDPRYKRGIEKRGGTVVNVDGIPRVNKVLAVARAIGDHELQGAISARPKMTVTPLSAIRPNSHLILCCDGIYDVARTVDVVKAVHEHRHDSPGVLAKNIVHSAYLAGSQDNLSALVVKIK